MDTSLEAAHDFALGFEMTISMQHLLNSPNMRSIGVLTFLLQMLAMYEPLQVRCTVAPWSRGPARVPYPVASCILSAGWTTRSKFVAPWPRGPARVPYPVAPYILSAGSVVVRPKVVR